MYLKFKTQLIKNENTTHAWKGEYLNFTSHYSLFVKKIRNQEKRVQREFKNSLDKVNCAVKCLICVMLILLIIEVCIQILWC